VETVAFARAYLMYCGHSPAEIDAMPLRDVRLFVEAVPLFLQLENPFAEAFES
jgi:hypothetical protein